MSLSINLWPHQLDAISAVAQSISNKHRSGLLEIPTGGGKTTTFVTVAQLLGLPTLVLVHRDELIRQTVNTTARLWPEAKVGIIQGPTNDWRDRDLVVASVQSLKADRLAQIPSKHFGLVVADECHHVPAPTWSRTLRHFEPFYLLGVTATCDRLDGRGLAEWFGPKPLYSYSLCQAIEDGILTRIHQFAITTHVNLDNVVVRAGDFGVDELSQAVATAARNKIIVDAFLEHAPQRKAIVFAVDLEHVEQLTQAFRDAGVVAACVTGNMLVEERRQALADFASGHFQVLVNCEVCTEGYDERTIECVIMARPTRSRALYQQCVGRGLRICPENRKQDCLVLDITDNCRKHQLMTVFDLFGDADLRNAAGADVLKTIVSKKEKQRVEEVRVGSWAESPPAVTWNLEEVPPWPQPSRMGHRPPSFLHGRRATPQKTEYSEELGIVVRSGLTKSETDRNGAESRYGASPATEKQQWFLKNVGQWREGMSKEQAWHLIRDIKSRGDARNRW